MLGSLQGFTIVTDHIDAARDAYATFLDYRCEAFTFVSEHEAERWNAPALLRSRQALLRPASGHRRFIRLIEHQQAPAYPPLTSFGWNAIEIVVRDLDAVASRLAGSPFTVIGAPETLDFDFTDKIRAMQVVGLCGEVLYLTEIAGDIPGFVLPVAQCPVDCAFVAVLGTAKLEASSAFYATLCGTPTPLPLSAKIGCLSVAHGLPEQTRHRLTTLTLPQASLIEIDAYPQHAAARAATPCGLPAGIAFASFAAPAVAQAEIRTGPDQEWIELLPVEGSFP